MKKILLSLALIGLMLFIGLPKQTKAQDSPDVNFTLCYSSDNSLFSYFSASYSPFYDDNFYEIDYYEYLGVYTDVYATVSLNKEKEFLFETDTGIIYGFDQNFAVSLNYRRYRTPFPNHIGITAWYIKTNPKSTAMAGVSIISKKGAGVHFQLKQLLTKTIALNCFTDMYYTSETKLLMGGVTLGKKISDNLFAIVSGRCFLFEKEDAVLFIVGGLQYSF